MRFRKLAALVALSMSTMTMTGLAPASAGPTECDPSMAKRYRIETYDKKAVVTHAFNKVLAPGSQWSRTTTIERVNFVKASVEAYAEGTAGAQGVIAKAEVKAGTNLKAAGSHTRRRAYSDYISINNTTKANREYVVYYGTMKHFGKYRATWCGSDYQLRTQYGKWKSWTVRSSGTVRCDLSAPNRVAAKAKRLYCG